MEMESCPVHLHDAIFGVPVMSVGIAFVPTSSESFDVRESIEGPRMWRVAMDKLRARRVERLWGRHTITLGRIWAKPPYVWPRTQWAPSDGDAWYWRRALYRRWSRWRCRLLLSSLERLLRRHALDHPTERRVDPVRFLRTAWFESQKDLFALADAGVDNRRRPAL